MRKKRYFTQPEMEEVWDRWENGEFLNSIARGLERGHSPVQGMLSRTGGVRPAPKKRCVIRDDLPHAVHPGPRSLEERADQVLAA
jgi:hypothetical protein